MPITILPVGRQEGQSIAEGLGSGISSGLQALANMKLQEMQKQQAYERAKPFYEEHGISPSAYWAPPAAQAQVIKAQIENQGMQDLFGPTERGEGQGPLSLENMTYEKLSNRLAGRPARVTERFRPVLEAKKQESERLYKEMADYEKTMEPIIQNIEKFNTAIKQAREFAKKHPDLYGPYEGRTPNVLTTSPEKASLRKERDRLNNTIVTLSLPLEGAIGRGSNLLVKYKAESKASAAQYINDYLKALKDMEEIYNAPKKIYDRYSKMREKGKLKSGFRSQLHNKLEEALTKAGATVTDVSDMEEVGRTENMPSAVESGIGSRYYNDETNQWYESDGQQWIPMAKKGM